MAETKQIYPGLTEEQAKEQLKKDGPNDVKEKTNKIRKVLAPLYSPISLMLLGAGFLSFLNHKAFDSYFILALYFVNYFIQKWQEFKADKALKSLQDKLSVDVSVLRSNKWKLVNSKDLVLGDRVRMGLGALIPFDGKILFSHNLSVNEAALTGESLPKAKKENDQVFSGSFVSSGDFEAVITATGSRTFFGKTLFSLAKPKEKSLLEKDILTITRFLTAVSIFSVALLSAVFLFKGADFKELLGLDLSLIIAGIPIALPAVMAIILSIGASSLAKKMVVVRRLSALQDLSNVNLLLTDKTGTLTKNEIEITNVLSLKENLSSNDVVELAFQAVSLEAPNAIDQAVMKKFHSLPQSKIKAKNLGFVPYDSVRKRSTALFLQGKDKILVSLGAPQVIEKLCSFYSPKLKKSFKKEIEQAALRGFRVLALASKNVKRDDEKEEKMELAGLLFLADPLDISSKETIAFMRERGIGTKMLTGDNQAIAQRIAQELGLVGETITAEEIKKLYKNKKAFFAKANKVSTFAEILPDDKYEITKLFRARYVTAVTGDGINDLPALKTAHVGIAVKNAVSSLKSMADIVLLSSGIAVIKEAILEARRIFVRLYNYSVYRISESFRLIITILLLGLFYGFYPLQPLQLILLAFLNDIPIISLAFDRVKAPSKPAEIKAKQRFSLSLLFGLMGIFNSFLMFILMTKVLHFSLSYIQTMFFLKLTVSGHSLIFVAHTKERWFKFLPSKAVIIATILTQVLATFLALSGLLMPSKISLPWAVFVWVWALVWMQMSELMKIIQQKLLQKKLI